MSSHEIAKATTTDGIAVSPALDLIAESAAVPLEQSPVDSRLVLICGLAILLGLAAALLAQALLALIALITNVSFFGHISLEDVDPASAAARLGLWIIPIPIVGGLIVGMMARYGSKAIRGHGIPEAMEQVLVNESRIPARITFLKPLSAAVAIGTGGPFGAEGPIIATGGALGSLLGQLLPSTAAERKTLLAAGAAAGMAATFGSPVSAVLLAIELLLFEFRPRSIIPVALAAVSATSLHLAFFGTEPVFAMPDLQQPSAAALTFYVLLGALMGLAAVLVTRAVYFIEDRFEKLPFHWMWWPAFGGLAVGVVGWIAPDTLGVGYHNIQGLLANSFPAKAAAVLCLMKFISWSVSLSSGTSGGTLAPLLTIGGGLGTAVGATTAAVLPDFGVDLRIAALVGMAALFAGASRAMLASVVFAFETTLQPLGLMPLLGGCAASYLISSLLMRTSIMTEKIERRGIRAPAEYVADSLERILVRDVASRRVVSLRDMDTVRETRERLLDNSADSSHQGFPILDERQKLVGVLTRRDILASSVDPRAELGTLVKRIPKFVYDDCTVRQAADHMLNHDIGRLPVVRRGSTELVGIITRSDVLSAFRHRLNELEPQRPLFRVWRPKLRRGSKP
jgi:H+/Cl- antiporter ClcA/CBS domain-containing protein